jgi:hypothetical protein
LATRLTVESLLGPTTGARRTLTNMRVSWCTADHDDIVDGRGCVLRKTDFGRCDVVT